MYIKPEHRKTYRINISSILYILAIIILFSYTSYDAFVFKPEYKAKVDTVAMNFEELKIYLDKKIPEIDSALILHTRQIDEQNRQLDELNNITETLK